MELIIPISMSLLKNVTYKVTLQVFCAISGQSLTCFLFTAQVRSRKYIKDKNQLRRHEVYHICIDTYVQDCSSILDAVNSSVRVRSRKYNKERGQLMSHSRKDSLLFDMRAHVLRRRTAADRADNML